MPTPVSPARVWFYSDKQLEIKISDEHTDVQWLDYEAARDVLRFDSNRTALGELNERLCVKDLPQTVE